VASTSVETRRPAPTIALDTADTADAAVVICAYTEDRWDDILAAICSVDEQSLTPVERIVVVDHNTELLTRLRRAVPHWTVIPNIGPKGLSGARNTASETATAAWIAFLDDDASAERDWLRLLVEAVSARRASGGGGHVEPRWERKPRWLAQEFWWVVGCSYRGLPRVIADVRNPIGASMIVRTSLLAEIGGFSTSLGRQGRNQAGCEETEMCIRAADRTGGAFVYVPDSVVHHRVPASRATVSYFVRRCYAEGMSKRQVTELAGAHDGLSAERSFALRVASTGIARHLGALGHGDGAGVARALSIVVGMAVTSAGYAMAEARMRVEVRTRRVRPHRPAPSLAG